MSTSVTSPASEKYHSISYGFFCIASVLIWFIATVVLRFWGALFFIPNNHFMMSGSFLLALLLLPVLVSSIFRWQRVQPHQRLEASLWLAIPAMFLDVLATYFFPFCFPNLPATANGAFGAWLLWGYGIILMTGFVSSKVQESSID